MNRRFEHGADLNKDPSCVSLVSFFHAVAEFICTPCMISSDESDEESHGGKKILLKSTNHVPHRSQKYQQLIDKLDEKINTHEQTQNINFRSKTTIIRGEKKTSSLDSMQILCRSLHDQSKVSVIKLLFSEKFLQELNITGLGMFT